MERRKYKVNHTLIVIIQLILVSLGLLNGIRGLIAMLTGGIDTSGSPFVFNIAAASCLLYYAFYGYNHKDTSFRLACIFYIMSATTSLTRTVDLLVAAEELTAKGVLMAVSLVLSLGLMIAFSILFKHQQEIALVLGAIAALFELTQGIDILLFLGWDVDAILAAQPFVRTFIAGGLTACLAARFHYRTNEKWKKAKEEANADKLESVIEVDRLESAEEE